MGPAFALALSGVVLGCVPVVDAPTGGAMASAGHSVQPSIPPDDLQRSLDFRELYGLRTDLEWVNHVYFHPQSDRSTGVPLTPEEVNTVGAKIRSADGVIGSLTRYGEQHPDVYAGVIVEGSTAILLVKGDPGTHADLLQGVLSSGPPFEVRSVRWSLAELETFADTIEAERAWFGTIEAELVAADALLTNVVRVRYLGAPDVARLIEERFANPPWLTVEREGPLPWTGARGTLKIRVVDANGSPVSDAACRWTPTDPSVDADIGLAFSTDRRGRCSIDHLPATAYEVQVTLQRSDGEHQVIGVGQGRVPANGTTRITIVADR